MSKRLEQTYFMHIVSIQQSYEEDTIIIPDPQMRNSKLTEIR